MKSIVVNIARLLAAAAFLVSGFVKAVDPLGTVYKLSDYATALGLADSVPEWATVAFACLLPAVEFMIGACLALAIRRRLTAALLFAVMAVWTAVAVWLVAADPVSDCGCFGDAIKLTNGQTLAKNIVLLACAAVLCRWPRQQPRLLGRSNQQTVVAFTAVWIAGIITYCLWTLPILDFRPYHVGADIAKAMERPEGAPEPQFETTFILEKDGQRREFTLDNYPDSTWTFIDSHTRQTSEGYVPPVHDFAITRLTDGEDITSALLARRGYTLLLTAPHLDRADDSAFDQINAISRWAGEHNVPFYCLTASTAKAIHRWTEMTGAEYEYCSTDETTLKTMVRSNPGLILLKGPVVAAKWSCRNLPEETEIIPSGERRMAKSNAALLLYLVPLLLIIAADRAGYAIRQSKKPSYKPNYTMRKNIVAGNWKMNLNLQEGVALATELGKALAAEKPNCGVIICTPFIHLASVAAVLDQNVVALGAENCADKEKGAFTGEVSAAMVKSTGAQYVILGHSERRGYYAETPEILREKVQLALKNGLKVIFCIGESLEEREQGKQNEVVKAELEGSVFNLTAEEFANITVAYEPIWAIGTGKTATADQAEEIHAYIRKVIADKFGAEVADNTTILYGGSCKASNAPELFAKADIDGGLIGGASLKAADFKGIIDAFGRN